MSEQLRKQAEALQNELREKRKELKQLHDSKEELFHKRQQLRQQISKLINETKALRETRNKLTEEVKQAKTERSKLTENIKGKIGEFKQTDTTVKRGPSTGFLKQQIEKLQFRIETEGLTFEKEKGVMKQIRELEKELKNAQKANAGRVHAKEISHDIETLKQQADTAHLTVQQKADLSQKTHEDVVTRSKNIDELRKQEAELTAQIDAKKKELSEKGAPLDEKSKLLDEIRKQLGETDEQEHKQQAQTKKKKLSDLQKEVQEKIKKGEKLTTNDLLIMQSTDEHN